MATIKIKFRASGAAGREGSLVFHVIHKRVVRQLQAGYRVFASEWDEAAGDVAVPPGSGRRDYLCAVRDGLRRSAARLARVVKELEEGPVSFTADDVVERYTRMLRELSLSRFMEENIFRLRHNGKVRTAETYATALGSFRAFLRQRGMSGEDVMLDAIDSALMEDYEAWHHARGNTRNTFSFYARILRAVYRRAVDRRLVEDARPFRHVYTGVDRTVKRALPIRVIRQIRGLDLSYDASLEYARDMFMLSFMLRGMSFVDMAYLRKSDLHGGHLVYRRRKTGQRLAIEWTPEMRRLLGRYPENTSEYLLPIIRKPGENERSVYLRAAGRINSGLKKVALLVGLSVPLTLYVARHSWASAAKAKGVPLSVISEGMGHDSESTTRIYLASLETSVVDKANARILRAI